MDPQRPSRKGKERELVTDQFAESFQDKMIALQRKNASVSRTRERERPERSVAAPQQLISQPARSPKSPPAARAHPPSPRRLHQSPHLLVSRPAPEADPEDFSRRLKISSSRPSPGPRHHPAAAKLFNPDTDPIPMRRTAEPEAMSDAASSSYVSRDVPNGLSHAPHRDVHQRQLFDHRKDDPVRFSVLARPQGRPVPTPKSSGDYISASSTSSYANSVVSSSFTLSSDTTGGSSASSALFERDGRPSQESGNSVFAQQLKKLYRTITALEEKIKKDDLREAAEAAEESSRVVLPGKKVESEEIEKEKWRLKIAVHKQLAEYIHNLLEISLAPGVPASLRNIPTRYNIPLRLWSTFYPLLEKLRCASDSPLALEHLQEFIYYSYTFYTGVLEEPTLNPYKTCWLEALGDLARYRMIVATVVSGSYGEGSALTAAAVSRALADGAGDAGTDNAGEGAKKAKSSSEASAAFDEPSVGLAAARLLEVEPESERWRGIAREWYSIGIVDTPGNGKLHHHLGLLSRDVEGEDLRATYHFVKSLITLHAFKTAREAILPIWSIERQPRRAAPDARVSDLFVLLHGMLFTNIQLDDFQPTLARFLERLAIEGAEEREWIMMAVVNIGAVLEYGKPSGTLRRTGSVGAREGAPAQAVHAVSKKSADADSMDVDESEDQPKVGSPPTSDAEGEHDPALAFTLALQLAFAMLAHVLRRPTRRASPFAKETPNPYLTVLLTFLATVLKHPAALRVLERAVPWDELAAFFGRVPRRVMHDQRLDEPGFGGERWAMVTSGCAPPLPEDWCLRGMEWVSRKVYERGFWKSADERKPELEVLDARECAEAADGQIEDDDGDERAGGEFGVDGARRRSAAGGEAVRRWVRIVRCAVGIARVVEGFTWADGTRVWRVEGALAEKVAMWREQERVEREEEERRRMRLRPRWEDSMEVDEDGEDAAAAAMDEESEGDENDSDVVKALKARRKYLQSLLQGDQQAPSPIPPSSSPRSAPRRAAVPRPRRADTRPLLKIVRGYTILVVDTNILLSSLAMLTGVIESLRWTVVVPLPAVMELDGLASASNATPLGDAARDALAYVSAHVRSHAAALKVLTSRGNYLPTLAVRTEEVDFVQGADGEAGVERNMDDLILKAAIWQDEHWVDRSAMLGGGPDAGQDTKDAVKVVLLTLDRNLRLKARSRSLPAASERDLAAILATGT